MNKSISVIHRIADTPPQFPCWVWSWAEQGWYEAHTPSGTLFTDTHWCQSPTRPTVTPEAETSRSKVVTERENAGLLAKTTYSTSDGIRCKNCDKGLTAHTDYIYCPKVSQKPITDAAQDAAEKLATALFGAPGTWPDKKREAALPIIRRYFDAATAELREDRDFWDRKAGEQYSRANKAEAKIEALFLLLRSNVRFNKERNAYEWVIYGTPGNMSESVESAVLAATAPKKSS
jgi:hypothetical protein